MLTGHTPLVSTIVIGLVLAFALGLLAQRLKISPLVGYLLAGVVIGPFTPGFVADQGLTNDLAEIGIILLMFGVGLQFSLEELLSVRGIAVPGALAQIVVATALGLGLATLLGWSTFAGIVFGIALSVASTVVVLRNLQERRLLDTERGHIAVGWLVVEDLAMVLVLVLLPALADIAKGHAVAPALIVLPLVITLGKFLAFVILMWFVGRRVIPWLLHYVAHTGSRELFRLAVLSIALGVAFGSAILFAVSLALGAFFAGMILSESTLSQRAAQETLPLRDAFAVLFFVSVGMLFDPAVLLADPRPLAGTLLVVMAGNAGIAFLMMRSLRQKLVTSLIVAAGLAQIGEFSYILADLGIGLGLLPDAARQLVLATSLLAILANPLLFELIDRLKSLAPPAQPAADDKAQRRPREEELPVTSLSGHAVLVGYGRVGQIVASDLMAEGWKLLVIDERPELVEKLRAEGVEAFAANGAEERVLKAANLPAARLLLVAIPEAFEAGQIVEQARRTSPSLEIIARAHFDAAVDHLTEHGANVVIMGEREIAHGMAEHARSLAGG
jgi:CPA2 family monovalent cation:H+ antiporter-2